ncbi:MAG TPA: hypothetical protein VE687_19405 [Stellaceae bacterium]|nr:hypothetical protein [Stellaceae bacterium]
MAVIDTLKLARALRDKGGFSQEAAEATAEALDSAFGDTAPTKRHLADLGTSLRAETAALGTALRTETAALGTTLREEIGRLRSDVRLLKWQVGLNSALSIAILIKLFGH